MNKKTRPLTPEEVEQVLLTLKSGYKDKNNVVHRQNVNVAFACYLESTIGLRISDIMRLTINSNFIKKNNKDYYLVIREKKTGKEKQLYCPIYDIILNYCLENDIKKNEPIIKGTIRNIQKQIALVVDYLGLDGNINTHSFRKCFATRIYENSDYDLVLLQSILLHDSIETTKKYVGINTTKQKEILKQNIANF